MMRHSCLIHNILSKRLYRSIELCGVGMLVLAQADVVMHEERLGTAVATPKPSR